MKKQCLYDDTMQYKIFNVRQKADERISYSTACDQKHEI